MEKAKFDQRYDDLFRKYAAKNGLPWLLVKCQAWQESRFNPNAKSPCGAMGLMQLMKNTDLWLDGDIDGFDPEGNVENGCRYMAYLLGRLKEIPEGDRRLKFTLAGYNGGLGFVNEAMEIAYLFEFKQLMPKGHIGAKPGLWQFWERTCGFLMEPTCMVGGKRPDYAQIITYVDRIWFHYLFLQEG